jgi:amino acid adenylation domain-containing protein
MLVSGLLEQAAARDPAKIALVSGDDRVSYEDVDRTSTALALTLKARGLQRCDRVLIFLNNSIEAIVAAVATWKAGGVVVPVHPTAKAPRLAYISEECRPRFLISDMHKLSALSADEVHGWLPSQWIVLPTADAEVPEGCLLWSEAVGGGDGKRVEPGSIDIDLAAIMYTSGSTGRAKGVMLSHRIMTAAVESVLAYLGMQASDIILNVIPLSWDYGLFQILKAFQVGARVILAESFSYPARVLARGREEHATGFPGVPTIFAVLARLRDPSKHACPEVRYVTNTAAALPPAILPYIRMVFPNARIFSMYGMTECKRVSYLPPGELDERPTSVGKAIPNHEVFIVDDSLNRLPPGEIGELVVRGPTVMLGYWQKARESAEVLPEGPWPGERMYRTGDLFRMDDEGYLYFVARKDDIIKCRGQKVSPKEVEDVLYGMPEVAEVAVIGVPDEVEGQVVKAIVVPRRQAGLTERDVRRHCAANLESYMVPALIELRSSLPKSPNGKIDKKALAASARAEFTRPSEARPTHPVVAK